MTDPTDPTEHPDPLDALVSDHLDGRTTEAEAARVEADPELSARVVALAAARDALRAEMPPVDPDVREAGIAAALAAFDDERSGAVAGDGLAAVTAPAIGRAPSRRTLRLVAIAAAAVLLALAVPLLAGLSDDDDAAEDVAATALDEADGGTAERDAEAGSGEDAGGGTAADAAPSQTYDATAADDELGAFEDLAGLETVLRARVQPGPSTEMAVPSSTTTAVPPGAERAADCSDAPPLSGAEGPLVFTGTATLDGRPVIVLVHRPSSGDQLRVLDATDCSLVAARPL